MVLAHLLVRSQLTVYVRIYSWTLFFSIGLWASTTLFWLYCSFVESCEIRKCGLLALFSFLQFVLAMKVTWHSIWVLEWILLSLQKISLMLDRDYIESIDWFELYQHLFFFILKCHLLLCNSEPFLNWIVMCNKKWILYNNLQKPTQWLDWEEAPKYFPKPNLHQKRSWPLFGGLLPVLSTAAAAKSLQLSPTLCDPIDSSPPGSPVPGILQARTLEWVAVSFSNVWKWKVKVKSLSRVRLLATPWTAAYQAPPSMGFSRQEYWSGVVSTS